MSNHNHDNGHHSPHHIQPISMYWKVWGALVAFTVITVASSYIDFGGNLNIIVAMIIATTKALLVTSFFMGLKYDSSENNIAFYSTVVFLGIFVVLTSTDVFHRIPETKVRVIDEKVSASKETVDMNALIKPTPDLNEKGKALYAAQCATCHGAAGKGDGPAAASLNPKPRNFTAADSWKNARSLAGVYKTITNGLAGTPMPSFSNMSIPERMALAHYVRTFMPNAPADSAAETSDLIAAGSGGGKPKITIDMAIERMKE